MNSRFIEGPAIDKNGYISWKIEDADTVGLKFWKKHDDKTPENQVYATNRVKGGLELDEKMGFEKNEHYVCDFILQNVDKNIQDIKKYPNQGKLENLGDVITLEFKFK